MQKNEYSCLIKIDYRVLVDEIEAATGFDFLSNFPQDIQAKIIAVLTTNKQAS